MFNKKFLKHYYIMLIPAIIWLVLFNIVPMVGIVMAFEDFNPGLGHRDGVRGFQPRAGHVEVAVRGIRKLRVHVPDE